MHRLRVAWTFFRIGLLNELAYRANLYLQVLQSGMAVAGAIGGLLVVFGHTDSLRGWGPDEVLAVLGVYLLMGAGMGGVIEPSMQKLMEDVRQGTLDYTLTKPEEAQSLVSVSEIRVWKLVDVVLGLAVLGVALARRRAVVAPADVALFALMLLAGAAIIYSFLLAMAAVSFWFLRIDNILVIFSDMYQAARWPIGIYPGWLRMLLTFVVPVAIAITVPAEALVGRLTGSRVLLAWGVAAGAMAAARFVWVRGLPALFGGIGVSRKTMRAMVLVVREDLETIGRSGQARFGLRCSLRITSLSADQTSSTAQTLTSTRPRGSAWRRMSSSPISLRTPEVRFGHDTQIIPSGAICRIATGSVPASPRSERVNRCHRSTFARKRDEIVTPSAGSTPTSSPYGSGSFFGRIREPGLMPSFFASGVPE